MDAQEPSLAVGVTDLELLNPSLNPQVNAFLNVSWFCWNCVFSTGGSPVANGDNVGGGGRGGGGAAGPMVVVVVLVVAVVVVAVVVVVGVVVVGVVAVVVVVVVVGCGAGGCGCGCRNVTVGGGEVTS